MSTMNIWLGEKRGYLSDWITQKWVILTGRQIDNEAESWLSGLTGNTRLIGEEFYQYVSEEEDLIAERNRENSGLLDDLDVLRNDSPNTIDPAVKDFYQHTINYGFDVWSEWCGFFRPFGRLLALIFSRRLQQLNVPLDPMDTSRGVSSEVILLNDKSTGETKHRIWLRKKADAGHVIYAGCYGWVKPPNADHR
jgi:hypothetical protein